MKINLTPMRSDAPLVVAKRGDVLTLNGEAFDLSVIPEGATLPAAAVATPWLAGEVHRQGGALELTLVLPHGRNPSDAVAFPAPLIDPPDGLLELPHDEAPVEAEPDPLPFVLHDPEPEPAHDLER